MVRLSFVPGEPRRYAKKGSDVQLKMAVTGFGLALSFSIATHFFAGEHQLEIFALFLALTSCVYGGAVLTQAGAKYSLIELPFVVIVFVTSILGLLFSPSVSYTHLTLPTKA